MSTLFFFTFLYLHETCRSPVWVVMEYAAHGNLRDYLRASMESNLPASQLCGYCTQVLGALGYLESVNVIHRDIACRNVLVFSSETVKLSDFGCEFLSVEEASVIPSQNLFSFLSFLFFLSFSVAEDGRRLLCAERRTRATVSVDVSRGAAVWEIHSQE